MSGLTNSGVVTFLGESVISTADSSGQAQTHDSAAFQSRFQIFESGVFSIRYATDDVNPQTSAPLWEVGGSFLPTQTVSFDSSGTLSVFLAPRDYRFFVDGLQEAVSLSDQIGSVSASHHDTFSFLFVATAVPEPSTWAMMILGFAGVGFMAYPSNLIS
jgi:hypothetical protein